MPGVISALRDIAATLPVIQACPALLSRFLDLQQLISPLVECPSLDPEEAQHREDCLCEYMTSQVPKMEDL